MQEHTRTPVFQEKNGTWRHLTKTVNSLICTIEYGSSAGFSSKEDALESYQQSMDAYQDQISRLKKSRNMPFTFSEYLNYWLRDVYTPIFNSSSAQLRNRWVIELIILPHLHKDILLDCISTGYINKVLGDCQKSVPMEDITLTGFFIRLCVSLTIIPIFRILTFRRSDIIRSL